METIFVGKNLIFLPEVTSTNSYATELLKNVKPLEGTLVFTDHQTHGRGQRGKAWNSEPTSNLTFSVLLSPKFLLIENHFYLYQIAALACHDALTEFINTSQFDIKIKWPNDILVDGKKICGILIENILLDNQLNWSVIGFGVNVNQLRFDEGLNAASIKQLNGFSVERKVLMGAICKHLEKYYLKLKENKFEDIYQLFLLNMFALNEVVCFQYQEKLRMMRVMGIAKSGLLSLLDEEENLLEVDVKDIKWLLNS
jgi:BirA family biotin operon repressor/biotin-[acetyl-CoA-carboxylase] ligase